MTATPDRREMPFRDSRLYRQAGEFADRMLAGVKDGFNAAAWITRLGGGPTLRFDTLQEGREVEQRLAAALVAFAGQLDHRHFTACTLEACSRHYRLPAGNSFVGMAFKTALAISTQTWLSGVRGSGRAFADYWELIVGCSILNQVEFVLPVLEAYGDGRCEATPTHMDHDEDLLRRRRRTDLLFGGQPFIHRTGLDAMRALFLRPHAALQALTRVLCGAHPADQEIFQGTIFARLPAQAQALWIRLFVRVHLATLASDYRREFGVGSPFGLFVFETFGVIVPPGIEPVMAEGNASLMWEAGWVSQRRHHWRANLFVERPVLPLQDNLFATTVDGLLDSAAWLVEAALYHFAEARETWIDGAAFAKAVSQPFEEAVRAQVHEGGWRAGWVAEKGRLTWMDGTRLHLAPGCPGEIDAIALVGDVLWVLECKCLQFPFLIPGRLQHMVSRLNQEDTQLYHAKLAEKVRWLQRQLPIQGLEAATVRGALVLDRSMPGMLDESPHPVIEAQSLVRFLRAPDAEDAQYPQAIYEWVQEQNRAQSAPVARSGRPRT